MRQISPNGQQLIHEIAMRHGFSDDGVTSMLYSVINGNGSMAQFSHPDFSGSGQWMRGGMTMVSDMFNNSLKGRVDSLCNELSNLVANEPNLVSSGSFQSQQQGSQQQGHSPGGFGGQFQNSPAGGSQQQQQGGWGSGNNVSLFVPPTRENTGQWWPEELGQPSSTGAQNDMRYAYFPQARRLAVNVNGKISVYDTLDHQIGGFSQQQSGGSSVTFTSQYGLVNLLSLPIISGESLAPPPVFQPSASSSVDAAPAAPLEVSTPNAPFPTVSGAQDVFATIEKLAGLLEKGYLTPEEFAEKKKDLLGRL